MKAACPVFSARRRMILVALATGMAGPVGAAPPPLAHGEFISGGAGSEERETLFAQASLYNLQLTFAETGTGAYVADVQVKLDAETDEGLHRVYRASGPLFYVNLAAGRYRLALSRSGQNEQIMTVTVAGQATQARVIYWPAK